MFKINIILLTSIFLFSCSAEIGSEQWCADLKEKPKGEWTTNELTNYAKHCIF